MDSQDQQLQALLALAEAMGVKIDPKVLKMSVNIIDQGVDPVDLATAIKRIQEETQI